VLVWRLIFPWIGAQGNGRGPGLTGLANVHDHNVLVLPERVGDGGLRQEFVTRQARESASQTRLSRVTDTRAFPLFDEERAGAGEVK
jgi:hypothetical protein